MTETVKKSDQFKTIAQALFIIYVFALYVFSFQEKYVDYTEYVFYLFAGVVILYVAARRKLLITTAHYCVLAFCFVSFLSSIWAIDTSTSMQSSFSLFLLALMSVLVYQVFDKQDVDKLMKTILFAGVALVFYTMFDVGFGDYMNGIFDGDRLGGAMNAPNTFGVYCSISFLAGVYLFRKKKLFYTVMLLLLLSGILASTSRNAFIITTVGVVMAFFMAFKKTDFTKKFTYLVLFLAVLGIIYKMGYFDSIFTRLEDLDMDAAAEAGEEVDPSFNTRLFMIEFGFGKFFSKPLFGYGIANAQFLLEKVWAKTYLHNNYVELLVNVGLVGFVCYYATHVTLLKDLFRKRKEPFDGCEAVIILLVVLMLADMSIVFYYNKLTYIVLTMAMLLGRSDENENAEEKNEEKKEDLAQETGEEA